jgi:hypothetical protein
MGLKSGKVFNNGRGRLAWGCFFGEGGRGSFVGDFVKQEDLQKLIINAKLFMSRYPRSQGKCKYDRLELVKCLKGCF